MIVPPRARTRLGRTVIALAAGLASANPGAGQFRAGVDLVEVYATVTDTSGRPVTGLAAEDFRVAEDGRPEAIAAFAEGDVPLAVAIAVDHSFSLSRRQVAQVVAGAERFLGALNPEDEAMVLGVGSETAVLTTLSADRAPAVAVLRRLEPWGTTPLYDAVVEAIARIDAASGRRALVLLSDGNDRYSETSGPAMVAEARRRNVLVYPVVLGRQARADLVNVARVTGGRFVAVADPERLLAELETIAAELRAQYLIGYSSQAPPPDVPTWRAIDVTVGRPGTTVRAREGYLAR